MKKNRLDRSLLLWVVIGLSGFNELSVAADDVINDKQGRVVNKADLELLLKPAPAKTQLELLKNKANFQEKAQQIYLTKAIAAEVKKQGLPPEEQAELEKEIDLFYFKSKINQLTTRDLPDFEPLAKLEYKANKEKYMEPEKVAVEHIMVDNRKHGEDGALKLANDIMVQLKQGKDFSKLAEKYSEDPSFSTNHGKLGLFPRKGMIPEFDNVAFNLKVGEVSNLIQTGYGYHILKKYEHQKGIVKDYAAVKDEIIAKVKKEYIKNRLDEFYEKTKKDNAMKIDEKALDAYASEKVKQLEAQVKAEPAVTPVLAK